MLYYPIRYLVLKIKLSFVAFLMNKLEKALRWNLFLTFLVSNYAEITLYSLIEFMSFKGSSFLSVFSLLVAILMIVIALYFLWKTLLVSKDITKRSSEEDRKEESSQNEAKERWEAYETLYEPYKGDSVWTQGFLFVLSVRIILCYLIIATMYKFPIAQSVILSLLSLASLIYIIVIKPMDEFRELIENIVFEAIVLLVNICVIALALLDGKEGDSVANHRDKLGTAIVVFNTSARILSTIFVFYGVGSKLYEYCRSKRKYMKKLSCLSMKKIFKSRQANTRTSNHPESSASPETQITMPAAGNDQVSQISLVASIHLGVKQFFARKQSKNQQAFKCRIENKKNSLEVTRDILRKLFRPNSLVRRVAPEPYNIAKIPPQNSKIKAEPPSLIQPHIMTKLIAKRNIHKKPLFVASDGMSSNDENGFSSGNETVVSHNLLLKQSPSYSEDYFPSTSNKSSISKKFNGRPSIGFDLGTATITNHGAPSSYSLADFSQSQSLHSLLKTEKIKAESLVLDDIDKNALPQFNKRISKSIFQAIPSQHIIHKTMKNRLSVESLNLESPNNGQFEASSSIQNLITSPKNGRFSPQGHQQVIESVNSEKKLQSLLDVGMNRELSLEKRNSRSTRRVILETIPENPKKSIGSLEEIPDVVKLDLQVDSIDKINSLV